MNKYHNLTKTLENLEKIADFIKKNSEFRDIKMLKQIHYLQKLCSALLSNPKGHFIAPEAGNKEMTKIFEKLEKKCKN